MDKFKQVSQDIINAIDNIQYTDQEMKFYRAGILLNLCRLLESKEKYDSDIKVLKQSESARISEDLYTQSKPYTLQNIKRQ